MIEKQHISFRHCFYKITHKLQSYLSPKDKVIFSAGDNIWRVNNGCASSFELHLMPILFVTNFGMTDFYICESGLKSRVPVDCFTDIHQTVAFAIVI